MCYVCGTIHRPGENTLCPVTQVAGKREPRSLDEICRIARESQLESLQKQATPLGLHIVTTAQMAVLEAASKLSTASLQEFGPQCALPWPSFANAELARREQKR